MYNNMILDQMVQKYGLEKAVDFCKMVSTFYDIKFKNAPPSCFDEFDFERQWWLDKHNELSEKIINTDAS